MTATQSRMKSEMSPARRIVQLGWKSTEEATGASVGESQASGDMEMERQWETLGFSGRSSRIRTAESDFGDAWNEVERILLDFEPGRILQRMTRGVQAMSDWVSRKWRISASVVVRELMRLFPCSFFPLIMKLLELCKTWSRVLKVSRYYLIIGQRQGVPSRRGLVPWKCELEPWITHPFVELSSVPGHRLWHVTLLTIGDRCGGFIEGNGDTSQIPQFQMG
ncbi:hypothetical protein Acr_12g0006160 [Actinidia rufa]|uniref:Uncharacterized protein n=1 Tax=Actinidia rufa TaxID=165716 RepID=A0A7J0FHA2_9ERIC|nr:hypothetical protein Acr_12g0006160 [Actinidia rufa]